MRFKKIAAFRFACGCAMRCFRASWNQFNRFNLRRGDTIAITYKLEIN